MEGTGEKKNFFHNQKQILYYTKRKQTFYWKKIHSSSCKRTFLTSSAKIHLFMARNTPQHVIIPLTQNPQYAVQHNSTKASRAHKNILRRTFTFFVIYPSRCWRYIFSPSVRPFYILRARSSFGAIVMLNSPSSLARSKTDLFIKWRRIYYSTTGGRVCII